MSGLVAPEPLIRKKISKKLVKIVAREMAQVTKVLYKA